MGPPYAVSTGPPNPAQRAAPWCDEGVTTAPARHLVTLGPGDLADRLSEALQVYVAAMGYPPSTARQRRALRHAVPFQLPRVPERRLTRTDDDPPAA